MKCVLVLLVLRLERLFVCLWLECLLLFFLCGNDLFLSFVKRMNSDGVVNKCLVFIVVILMEERGFNYDWSSDFKLLESFRDVIFFLEF